MANDFGRFLACIFHLVSLILRHFAHLSCLDFLLALESLSCIEPSNLAQSIYDCLLLLEIVKGIDEEFFLFK